jgi:DNA-binding NtrC family response regulator
MYEVLRMKLTLHSQIVPLEEVPKESSPERDAKQKLDVLVVDDEPVIADTLAMILSKSGYRVMAAYGGDSAMEIAREYRPALLITDVVMPGMTGIELALALETVVPECKVLLFSGQAATVDLLAEAREKGRDFTIVNKPIHPADMIRRVSEYVQPAAQDSYATVN